MHPMPAQTVDKKIKATSESSRKACPRHPGVRCACGMGNLYRFVEPLILLELSRTPGASGYDLLERLSKHSLTGTTIDKAAVYRTLCLLESQGMAVVEHLDSVRGAGKKAYKLTKSGCEHLSEWGILLGDLSKGLAEFSREVGAMEPDSSLP